MVSARRQSTDYRAIEFRRRCWWRHGIPWSDPRPHRFRLTTVADTERALTRTLYKGRRCPLCPSTTAESPHCCYLADYLSTMDQPSRGPDPLTMTPPVSMLEVDDVRLALPASKDLADRLSASRWIMTFRKLSRKRQGQSSSHSVDNSRKAIRFLLPHIQY